LDEHFADRIVLENLPAQQESGHYFGECSISPQGLTSSKLLGHIGKINKGKTKAHIITVSLPKYRWYRGGDVWQKR
jgi:hypothetical protein